MQLISYSWSHTYPYIKLSYFLNVTNIKISAAHITFYLAINSQLKQTCFWPSPEDRQGG